MSPRGTTVWLAALVLLLGCSSAQPEGAKAPDASAAQQQESPVGTLAKGEPQTPLPVEADDARLGEDTAEVTLVAFLDYECRYCREAFGVLLELRKKYDAQTLRIVFKHLPLEGHALAIPAAIAGQAVADEAGPDAFVEFSRLVFEQQAAISYVNLAAWAEQVGVQRAVYNEAVSAETTLAEVATDARLAMRRGAAGTPTLFVNGRLIESAPGLADLVLVVDEERKQMQATPGTWAARYAARVKGNADSSLAAALLAEDPDDYRVPVSGSATLGNPSALVTLVVFTDFQCPYCKRADVTLHELLARHPGEIRLVFKHLPLPFHPSARPAARLAEAARKKSGDAAFFALSRELFDKSPELGADSLIELGGRHGLEQKAVELAISGGDPELEHRIDADLELADDVEAAGTPHMFINGKRIAGARPLEHFEAIFALEKRRAEQRVAKGVSPARVYDELQAGALQPGAPKAITPPPVQAESPTRGPVLAKVTIHVFSDFQCPYCRQAELTLLELEAAYPGKLRIVWHDRPLDFHPLALPAARAGREANRQGGLAAFWKFHAKMFGLDAAAAEVSRPELLAHAKALGLDVPAMEKAIDSGASDAIIERDIDLATSLGFQGTPAFVIGRYALTGARDLRHFKRLVDLSLAEPAPAAR